MKAWSAAALGCALLVISSEAAEKRVRSPLIVIDMCSGRPDHFSAAGYPRPTTPNLDAFAKGSTVFANAWAQSSWCLPNFATFMTGARPQVHGRLAADARLLAGAPKLELLAEILRAQGYKTAGFSGAAFYTSAYGLDGGFDEFSNSIDTGAPAGMMGSLEDNLPRISRWLNVHKDDPIFLYVSVDDLHSPYHSKDPKRFDPGYSGLFDRTKPDVFFDRAYNGEAAQPADSKALADVAEFRKDPRHLKQLIARYDAALLHSDALIRKLFDEIKAKGLWDKSLIVVTADHGESLGEHGLLGHVKGLYEQILHVPLMIKEPGQKAARRLDELVERIDIPATLLDQAGVLTEHRQFTGDSLAPLLRGAGRDNAPGTARAEHDLARGRASGWKKCVFAASRRALIPPDEGGGLAVEERAVRDPRHKLIWFRYKRKAYELFDLEKDGGETRPLGAKAEAFAALKGRLDSVGGKR